MARISEGVFGNRADNISARGLETQVRYKRLITCVSLLALVIVGAVEFRLTKGNTKAAVFDRIEVGMTETEVYAITGGPPKDELNGNYYIIPDDDPDHRIAALHPDEVKLEQWVSEGGRITIGFDKHDRVVDKRYYAIKRPGLFDQMRAWFGRN
jgi:hypothetical protein